MSTNDDRLSDESDSYDEEEDRPFWEWDGDPDDLKDIVHDVHLFLREKNFDVVKIAANSLLARADIPAFQRAQLNIFLSYVPGQPDDLHLEVARAWLQDAVNDSNINARTKSEIQEWKDVVDKMFEDAEELQQEWDREQDQEQEQEQVVLSDTVQRDNVEGVDSGHQEQERDASPNRLEVPKEKTDAVKKGRAPGFQYTSVAKRDSIRKMSGVPLRLKRSFASLGQASGKSTAAVAQAAMRSDSALGHVNEKDKEASA